MKLEKEGLRIIRVVFSMLVLVFLAPKICYASGKIGSFESLRGKAVPIEKLEGHIGGEWEDAARTILPVADGEMMVLLKHDREYLYLAFDIDDTTEKNRDEIQIYFDTLHNKGKGLNQPDDRHYVVWRSGQKFGDDIEAAVEERSGGWELEGRVSLSNLNNPQPGSVLGLRIYHRDTASGVTVWPQGSYYPDTWGDLVLKGEEEVPSVKDKPPTVFISVSPEKVRVGETFKVTVRGEDDVGLQAIWWWGEKTGVPELDRAHLAECEGKSFISTWVVTATEEGVFKLAADAGDSAYPTPGEPHLASEGAGIAYATISVVPKTIVPRPVITVKFVAGAPSSVRYSSTLGQVIRVAGEKFAPNTTYIFKWENRGRWNLKEEVSTNSRGEFQGQITLPSAVSSGYQGRGSLVCYDKATKTKISYRRFTLEKAVLTAPPSSTLGQVIRVTGEKFAPNTTYIFKWENRGRWNLKEEVSTNSRGEFQGQITLPSAVSSGYQGRGSLVCYDKATKTKISYRRFTLEKAVLTAPPSSTLGQVIRVTGEKFAPNTTYIFKWENRGRWNCEGELTTDFQGRFQGQIRLPSVIPAGYFGRGSLSALDKASKTVVGRTNLTI
ncbi:MAG: sugar-binding protein [bacterium]